MLHFPHTRATPDTTQFEALLLPHLDAAYNLARHLTRNDHDAQDVVQESYLRALRYWHSFRGAQPRAWLLAIVRHTAANVRTRDQMQQLTTEFNDTLHSDNNSEAGPVHDLDRMESIALLHEALDELPTQFREVLVLRELESLSYDEISRIVRAPIGTVMSRLSRARAKLAELLTSTRGIAR
jgi:RNA polymerase sigma-70 factor, ECF subfamily